MLLCPSNHRQEPLSTWDTLGTAPPPTMPPLPQYITLFSDRNVLLRNLCIALFPFYLSKAYLSKCFCFKIDCDFHFISLPRSSHVP